MVQNLTFLIKLNNKMLTGFLLTSNKNKNKNIITVEKFIKYYYIFSYRAMAILQQN